MLKTLTTILRARLSRSTDDLAERHALLILDGQIRDAAETVEAARRALAIVAARDESEGRRLRHLSDRIAALEAGGIAALRDGAEDLAARAAEAIAALEIDRAAAERDRSGFAAETERLRREAASAERRLTDVERGRRTAEAAEAVRRLRAGAAVVAAGRSPLRQAEDTLARLRETQAQACTAERIFDDATPDRLAGTLCNALEAAGYGGNSRSTPAIVLERLRSASRDPA